MIDFDSMKVRRLTPDYVFKPFDCGNPDLNDFLFNDSKTYLKNLLAVTYILETDTYTVAYFSVSNDKISVDDARKSIWRRIKMSFAHKMHRRDYPAVKLGRFAVDLQFQKASVGTYIVEFVKNMFVSNNRTGCAFITVDALHSALPFYLKNDFKCQQDVSIMNDSDTVQLYLSLNQFQ